MHVKCSTTSELNFMPIEENISVNKNPDFPSAIVWKTSNKIENIEFRFSMVHKSLILAVFNFFQVRAVATTTTTVVGAQQQEGVVFCVFGMLRY